MAYDDSRPDLKRLQEKRLRCSVLKRSTPRRKMRQAISRASQRKLRCALVLYPLIARVVYEELRKANRGWYDAQSDIDDFKFRLGAVNDAVIQESDALKVSSASCTMHFSQCTFPLPFIFLLFWIFFFSFFFFSLNE